jgi:hypothetical protein
MARLCLESPVTGMCGVPGRLSDNRKLSTSRKVKPHWSRTRPELVYRSGDQMMAVSYTVKGDEFVPEKPRVWIDKLGGTQWDLAPDGKRVLVLTPVDTPDALKQEHEVVFLENFFDELRRRAPVQGAASK